MPEYFYHKFPKDLKERTVVIVDPMVATGGSLIKCIDYLVDTGVKDENIRFVNMFSVKEGLTAVNEKYPGVKIYTAEIDPILDENKYIIPGVGDFGDRFFNTVN